MVSLLAAERPGEEAVNYDPFLQTSLIYVILQDISENM